MKRIILILIMALSISGSGFISMIHANAKNEGPQDKRRKAASTRRVSSTSGIKRKILRNPRGICTGCCDPCYSDSWNWRQKPGSRKKAVKHKIGNRRNN